MAIDWTVTDGIDTDRICEAAEISGDGAFLLVLTLMAVQRVPGITGAQVDALLSTMDGLAAEYLASGE